MVQISISDAAQAHFRKLLDNQEEGTNIRIFVVNPGTPNAECGVSYCPPDSIEESDTEMKYDTFSAFVDEVSLPFLEEAEIDYVTEELGAQLTLKAPNAKMRKVADVVVVTYHGGFECDLSCGDPTELLTGENEGYAIATQVEGIDNSEVVVMVAQWWM